jgi:hypothetical protein
MKDFQRAFKLALRAAGLGALPATPHTLRQVGGGGVRSPLDSMPQPVIAVRR